MYILIKLMNSPIYSIPEGTSDNVRYTYYGWSKDIKTAINNKSFTTISSLYLLHPKEAKAYIDPGLPTTGEDCYIPLENWIKFLEMVDKIKVIIKQETPITLRQIETYYPELLL